MSTELNSSDTLQAGNSPEQISFNSAMEAYHRNSDWWTVFASFDLPDFNPSPMWIAKKTNLPVEEVVEALEGLTVLGFLTREGGAFYPVKGKDFVKFDVKAKSKAETIEEHALISNQMLNQLRAEAVVAVDHRCFAGNLDTLKSLYADINAAFEKAYEKSRTQPNNDRIFKLTFTAVDVVNHSANGRGNL